MNKTRNKEDCTGIHRVSVVMAAFNAEKYIEIAVKSILNQTYSDFEFMVIDDGSTDQTSKILSRMDDPRLKVIYQDNEGLAIALNRGIDLSSGQYIARMDADDKSEPERLKTQIEFLDNNLDYGLVGTNANVMTEDNMFLYKTGFAKEDCQLRKALFVDKVNPFIHGSVMFRKNLALKCGLYNRDIKHHMEDFLLWRGIAKMSKVANIEKPLYHYRITPSAITALPNKEIRLKQELIKKIMSQEHIGKNDIAVLRDVGKNVSRRRKQSYYELRIGKIYQTRLQDNKKARRHFAKAISTDFLNMNAWVNWLLSYWPINWVQAIKCRYYQSFLL